MNKNPRFDYLLTKATRKFRWLHEIAAIEELCMNTQEKIQKACQEI